jgi:DNA modification methylase
MTVGAVAVRHGRRFIGFEVNPITVREGESRLVTASRGEVLHFE